LATKGKHKSVYFANNSQQGNKATRQQGKDFMGLTSTPPRIPVIHIGMPKTATKTLQWRLFSGHSEIFYLGRFDGPKFQKYHKKYDYCRDAYVQSLMNQIAYGRVDNPNYEECKKALTKIITPALKNNLLPVWSWESHFLAPLEIIQARAKNLKMVFDKAKIIINIRNPIDLVESHYFQKIKVDNVGGDKYRKFFPYYQPIDNWLHDNYDEYILCPLQYADIIQALAKQFGKDNVHVFLFEELTYKPRDYISRICHVMEINPEEGINLYGDKVENRRWTQNQINELIKTTKSIPKKIIYNFSCVRKRRKLLGLDKYNMSIVYGKNAQANISSEWQEKIFNQTRQGNLWLQENYNLPLDKYKYYNH